MIKFISFLLLTTYVTLGMSSESVKKITPVELNKLPSYNSNDTSDPKKFRQFRILAKVLDGLQHSNAEWKKFESYFGEEDSENLKRFIVMMKKRTFPSKIETHKFVKSSVNIAEKITYDLENYSKVMKMILSVYGFGFKFKTTTNDMIWLAEKMADSCYRLMGRKDVKKEVVDSCVFFTSGTKDFVKTSSGEKADEKLRYLIKKLAKKCVNVYPDNSTCIKIR